LSFGLFGKITTICNVLDFIRHCQVTFPKRIRKNSGCVLIELNGMHASHIAYSYFANALASYYDVEIYAYRPKSKLGNKFRFSERIRNIVENLVYKSFGAAKIVDIKLSKNQKNIAHKLFLEIKNSLKTKQDIERICVRNVLIGDLIYDTYLRDLNLPTINIDDEDFSKILLESISLVIFWQDYIHEQNVKAVNVSHCVYTLAIPLRVAVEKKLPSYQVNITHAYRMTSDNLFAYNEYKEYPEIFHELPEQKKNVYKKIAADRIRRRLSGEVGIDNVSEKNTFYHLKKKREIEKSGRIKILVATHCYFDSVHGFGPSLFPDYYEWMEFLGGISQKTDYDWFIKTHPESKDSHEINLYLSQKYKKFKILPSDISHYQIIDEGINYALTVHGTIGAEYAYLGIPVINAGLNNPHIGYDFNIHAADIKSYEKILCNLESKLSIDLDKDAIHEFYYMRNIYNSSKLYFQDYDKFNFEIGGYKKQFSPTVYRYWIENAFDIDRHKFILQKYADFIASNDKTMRL
jgi:hypothetical protein